MFVDMAATLPASDKDRAIAYYRDVLGLEPEGQDGDGPTMYSVAGSRFVIYQSDFAGTNRATAATFLVADIDSAAATLRSRGVEFEEVHFDEATVEDGITRMPDGSAGFWFEDSEGNVLGVFQFAQG